jgi:hypothetical protein
MTKVNQPLDHIVVPERDDDDDMPTEYTFSGTGTRGRFAKALREKGYTVTIHHEDGTTISHISPEEVLEQKRQREEFLLHPPT